MLDNLSYEVQGRNKMLKERTKRCVCKYCGGRLRLKQLSFSEYEEARTEIFCRNCDRIEFGVEPEVYDSAKYFVEQTSYDYYPDLEKTVKTKRMNIAKVCEIMTWQVKTLGYLTNDGFVSKPKKADFMTERLVLSDSDLEEIETVRAHVQHDGE